MVPGRITGGARMRTRWSLIGATRVCAPELRLPILRWCCGITGPRYKTDLRQSMVDGEEFWPPRWSPVTPTTMRSCTMDQWCPSAPIRGLRRRRSLARSPWRRRPVACFSGFSPRIDVGRSDNGDGDCGRGVPFMHVRRGGSCWVGATAWWDLRRPLWCTWFGNEKEKISSVTGSTSQWCAAIGERGTGGYDWATGPTSRCQVAADGATVRRAHASAGGSGLWAGRREEWARVCWPRRD